MTTLNAAIDGYLADAKTRCEMSTIAHYVKRLRPFQRELGRVHVDRLKEKQVLPLIESLNKWPDGSLKAPDTIRSNVSVWEQFQQWMRERRLIKKRITKKIKKPGGRQRELLPTEEETRALVAVMPHDFRQIYRALRLCGARPGELANAMMEQIDRTASEIIQEKHKTAKKTGKPRRIALGNEALVQIVNEAIGARTEGHIFLKSNGKPWTVPQMGAAYRLARKAAGVREGLVLYLTRHEHATAVYAATGDLLRVSMALGHKGTNMSVRHTRVSSGMLNATQQLVKENLEIPNEVV